MALRAFQFNPSIGGFGGESAYGNFSQPASNAEKSKQPYGNGKKSSSSGGATVPPSSQNSPRIRQENHSDGNGFLRSCDAFAQIVKELVDNAVDACAPADGGKSASKKKKSARENDEDENAAENGGNEVCKRVRVNIAEETFNSMEVLRITVIDTGCGMENIDKCVTVFSSSKNGSKEGTLNKNDFDDDKNKSKVKKNDGKKKTNQKNSKQSNEKENENDKHTAGRYGVGLTLCLLHAQRLVPGSEGVIQSAIASRDEWEKATYIVDTERDEVVCKKRVNLPKGRKDECGTSISLLVPGGDEARLAWPRLAEYFARFQLSVDLPCSLEVAAPTLSALPLRIYPPSELEKRHKRRMMRLPSIHFDRGDASDDGEQQSDGNEWEGNDGCDENEEASENESDDDSLKPIKSKAAQERERAQEEMEKRKELIRRGAKEYEGKDVVIKNVAYATQPIRRNLAGAQLSSPRNGGPVLEMSMIVFGPTTVEGGCDHDCDHDGNHNNHVFESHSPLDNSSRLSVVRMVNGIPLLDGPEALACGVVQKLANNESAWNSFGLDLSLRTNGEIGPDNLRERRKLIGKDTPTFSVNDSAQVAPFFRDNAHAAFHSHYCEGDSSSSDDDEFDPETMQRKRKKERSSKFILPAPLRLGHILMVVQIRAKPSDLPLPTLSKGRLPMNDKSIDDAVENAVTECLKSLQKTNPALLLTANQLKRLERDARYVPAIASAISSVMIHPNRRSHHRSVFDVISGWGGIENDASSSQSEQDVDSQSTGLGSLRSDHDDWDPLQEGRREVKVEAVRAMIERRLRFVVSDEMKKAKDDEEKEKKRIAREELAAERARMQSSKKKRVVESDGMMSDCLQSDASSGSRRCKNSCKFRPRGSPEKVLPDDDFDSDSSGGYFRESHLCVNGNHCKPPMRKQCPEKLHRSSFGSDFSTDESTEGNNSHRQSATFETEDTTNNLTDDEWF